MDPAVRCAVVESVEEMRVEPPAAGMNEVPESLAGRLAAGALPVAEALRYAIGVAEALRGTHARGRVYGFLQPAVIAIIGRQVRLTPSGPAALSPYFSPEQVAGSDLDARSDIFSLGAILYEMLSGRGPFSAPTRTALRMEILERDPVPLKNVSPALARLVERCLEKRPERRLQRMEILLAELKLQEILATAPLSRPSDAPDMPSKAEAGLVGSKARGDIRPAEPGQAAALVAPVAVPTKSAAVCPRCGSRDVHPSCPRDALECTLIRVGVTLHRCYRCYHRFLRVAGLSFKKTGSPVGLAASAKPAASQRSAHH